MSLRTLKFGDRTISYDTGLNNFSSTSSSRAPGRIIKVDKDENDDVLQCADQADDGIGTSDDETISSTSGSAKIMDEEIVLHPPPAPSSLEKGRRVVIKPDASTLGQLLNFDEEDEDDIVDDEHENEAENKRSSGWHKAIAKDLAKLSPRALERRHSITICENPKRKHSSSSSSSNSPRSNVSPKMSVTEYQSMMTLNTSSSSSDSRFIPEDEDQLRTLNLRLEEVAHIRSVLTKAELETIPLDNLRSSVERGKLCFTCMKTKFGLFYRGQKCEMCKQLVCANCHTKMRIPVEHFSNTPVFALSPSVTDHASNFRGAEETYPSMLNHNIKERKTSTCLTNNSVGSAPNSPKPNKRSSSPVPTISGAIREGSGSESLPPIINSSNKHYATLPKKNHRRKSWITSSYEVERERLEGSLLDVCTDCKDMVLQVIRASSKSRRVTCSSSYSPSSTFFSLIPEVRKNGEQRL